MSTAFEYPTLRDVSPFRDETVAAPKKRPTATQKEDVLPEDAIFTREQIRQFQADDAAAVSTIAKIMTTLFTYTVVIMTVVIIWTFSVVQ